ncbi:MAG: DUF456 domain-containing protein [Anaerolineaceae bacterium]|nr:DUF456 domain-containing protein [Anaerolineaceae bacterium]
MNLYLQYGVQALVLTVMLAGLVGLIVPVFPGLTVIWLADIVYGVLVGFDLKGWILFALITLLMIAGSLVDNFMMGKKAREGGASWWALAMGWVGGIVGSILLPPLGGIPAAILAVFAFEWVRMEDWRRALNLTKGMAIGWGWAFVARLGIGIVMIGLWGVWAWT